MQKLTEKGVAVYLVHEDAAERGIEAAELVEGVESISRADVARLFDRFDNVWHW